jgi:hypothetical protein
MKPLEGLEQWANLFYEAVVGNPYVREKPITADEFDLLAERAMQWAAQKKEENRD